MEETSGIGFKEAAAIARQFVLDLYEGDEQGPKLQNVLLEEIEFDRANNSWLVTIGFDRPYFTPEVLQTLRSLRQGSQYRRALKRVEIDDSGKVLRMIEREAEN